VASLARLLPSRFVLRAILFDLDGTLAYTEPLSTEAIRRVMERRGCCMSQAELEFVVGHPWLQIHEELAVHHGAAVPLLEDLITESAAMREVLMRERGLTPTPGALEVPRRLAQRFDLALVSASSRREATFVLDALGLFDVFRVVLTGEDYAPGKPSPRGYLLAAERLGVEPAGCLVVEDSRPGIAAGRAAGMRVVAVRAGNYTGQDQSAADVVVDTMCEIDDALLARLFPGAGGIACRVS
jgi:HAD superfamily hydrolase (TIGR01509 family)